MDEERVENKSASEAKAAVGIALEEAMVGGKWMAAVWRVKDGRIELSHITTYCFPRGDYLAAVGHLALSCSGEQQRFTEASKTLPDSPLPTAQGFEKKDGDNHEPPDTVKFVGAGDYGVTPKPAEPKEADADKFYRPETDRFEKIVGPGDEVVQRLPKQEEKPKEEAEEPPATLRFPPVPGEGEELQE